MTVWNVKAYYMDNKVYYYVLPYALFSTLKILIRYGNSYILFTFLRDSYFSKKKADKIAEERTRGKDIEW